MGTEQLATVDGAITPTADAVLALPDDGLYRGDGAFEVVRLYAGRPFALDEHLDRLERSAAAIELDFDRAALEHELAALIARVGAVDCQLRIMVTRGGRRIAASEPLPARGDTVSLASVTFSPSVVLTGVKSLSYAANMQATRLARARGADEAVLVTPDGLVLEAPTAALFWASASGELCTPSVTVGILESITRGRIISALEVVEGEFALSDLAEASEAFLASTTREVQPVSRIDDGAPLDAPGPRTLDAKRAFEAKLSEEV